LRFESFNGTTGDFALSGATVSGGIMFAGSHCSIHGSVFDCGSDGKITFTGAILTYDGDPNDFFNFNGFEVIPSGSNNLMLQFYDAGYGRGYWDSHLILTPVPICSGTTELTAETPPSGENYCGILGARLQADEPSASYCTSNGTMPAVASVRYADRITGSMMTSKYFATIGAGNPETAKEKHRDAGTLPSLTGRETRFAQVVGRPWNMPETVTAAGVHDQIRCSDILHGDEPIASSKIRVAENG
jgi:hypothetical protein